MKVAFDNEAVFTQKYGGVSNYLFHLVANLKVQGVEGKVFSPLYINEYFRDHKELINGTQLSSFPPFSKKILRLSSSIIARIDMGLWQPDILHLTLYKNNFPLTRNIPTVVTIHDFIHEIFNIHPSIIKIKKAAIRKADFIICVSQSTMNDLVRFYPEAVHKAVVVPLGYSQQENNVNNAYNKLFTNNGLPFLLFVGKRDGYKNFENLLRAYASSSFLNKNFRIIAFGNDGFSANEKNLFLELHLKESQIKHMRGTNQQLAQLYKNAALFVYPSKYEGFGIPPLEAFSNDCPVAASRISSIPEVCGDACVYFNPNSPANMAEEIEKVLSDSELRTKLIRLGRSRLEKFSWERCAIDTSKVYRNLLE